VTLAGTQIGGTRDWHQQQYSGCNKDKSEHEFCSNSWDLGLINLWKTNGGVATVA
jgi:hypothetical protein